LSILNKSNTDKIFIETTGNFKRKRFVYYLFKDYFPAIKAFSVDNDLLYVITNKKRNELWECIVMNLKGKELKREFVPLQESEPYTYYPLLYSIENGKFYALIENEDDETWELYITEIR
jgi:hypothetical protein